jgi:hypothetical protein
MTLGRYAKELGIDDEQTANEITAYLESDAASAADEPPGLARRP